MTQLPLGLYGRLNFFVSPVPLSGQLALAPETPLLAPKDRDSPIESQVKHRQIHGIHKFYIASFFKGVFKLLLKTEFPEVSDCATP